MRVLTAVDIVINSLDLSQGQGSWMISTEKYDKSALNPGRKQEHNK